MKNKSKILSGLLVFAFCLVHFSAEAQRSRVNTKRNTDDRLEKSQDKRTEDQVPLIDKLWFGGAVNFFWINGSTTSQLLVGIAPMVGYKVTDKLSFGPRIEVQYTSFKIRSGPNSSQNLNNLNFGGFGFGRYKIFRNFFIHVETGITTEPYLALDAAGNPEFVRELRQPVMAGLGYSEGGGEIYLLYDFNDPDQNTRFPFQYRFGFNYNF